MDRQALCKQITQTQNESERLSRGLQMLYHINPTNNPKDYEKISTDAALLGERITCRLRHLVYDMTEMKKASCSCDFFAIPTFATNLTSFWLPIFVRQIITTSSKTTL